MTKQIYNDDVEAMVNPHSKKNQQREHNRIRRKLMTMAVLLGVALVVMIAWIVTDLGNGTAIGVSAVCGVAAAFLGGQVWEAVRV